MPRITRNTLPYPASKQSPQLRFLREWRGLMHLMDVAAHLTAVARFAPASTKWGAETKVKHANLAVEMAFLNLRALYRSVHESAAVLDSTAARSTPLPLED